MSQVLLAFRWYLIVQVFGLAALPLALRLFRHLPDRGYGVSKPLGLLLTGWVFWLLTTLGWLRNTAGGVIVALLIVAAAGVALYLGNRQTNRPADRLPWRAILIAEIVFTITFAAWCVVRAHMPRIETAGGEKWMEIAFLRAILRSDTFPPHDPWLSGFAISYYYFGYVIVAMITRLAAISPSIAFNLGIATLFALTCTGAFSLVCNLIAGERREQESIDVRQAVLGGLLGPLLVAVMGNLEGLLEVLHARGVGSAPFWRWMDIIKEPPVPFSEGGWVPQRFFWWWQASRVVHDYTPWGDAQEVIDEFPAFSFLLGDMHPHVLALPFVLLALTLALNLYRRMCLERDTRNLRLFRWTIPIPLDHWELFAYAICLGGLGFLNTWDFPIYLSIVVAAYTIAQMRNTQHAGNLAFCVSRFTLLFVTLLAMGVVLYLPFWITFQSQAGGILPNLFNGTRLHQFLVMFGPLVFVAVAFVVAQARRVGVRAREVVKWTLVAGVGAPVALLLVAGIIVLLIQQGVIPAGGPPASYVATWLRGEPIPGAGDIPGALALVRNRFLLDPEVLSPSSGISLWIVILRSIITSCVWTTLILFALVAAVLLILKQTTSVQRRASGVEQPATGVRDFALLLFATGTLLVLSVEYIYLKDHFHVRMNTVFKLYFQAWVLWSIAGAYALAGFIRRGGRRAVVSGIAVLLIVAGLIYPVLAIPKRAGEQGGPATLDGAAYLAQVHPDDYAAIAWLNENVSGAPVILEIPGGAYDYEGRVSAHTGLPTLLGWSGHEGQWRGGYEEQGRRQPDIEALYTSVDADEVLTLLDKYGISYVYVGPLERSRYPGDGLAKFAGLMDTVYDVGSATIYRVRNDESDHSTD